MVELDGAPDGLGPQRGGAHLKTLGLVLGDGLGAAVQLGVDDRNHRGPLLARRHRDHERAAGAGSTRRRRVERRVELLAVLLLVARAGFALAQQALDERERRHDCQQ